MLLYVRISSLILLFWVLLGSSAVFAGTGKIEPIKYASGGVILAGTGKIDPPKSSSGFTVPEDGTPSFLDTSENSRSSTNTYDKEERRSKLQERRDIIRTLDEGIIKFLQPRDKKSFREIRRNYPDLNDQKSALLIFRSSLVQRYDAFNNKNNRLISDYYKGLFSEIDSQIEDINSALLDEKSKEKKNIFQSLIDSIFH